MFAEYILDPLIKAFNKFENNNAFYINEKFYTYLELAKSISKIRFALQHEQINCTNIGLIANDDLETYASIFAIWMEGYAYVPIDPRQPSYRNLEIIDQAEVRLLIDSSEKINFKAIRTIESSKLYPEDVDILPKSISKDSLAYILFTSGSTGKPKGVQITRDNIGAFMKAFWKAGFKIDQTDRCLQCFDLTFDVSIQSYLVPLTKGACIYTIPHDQIKYSYASGLLEDQKLTFGAMAPSMIRYLRPYFSEISLPDMRYIILTAEASQLELVEEWSKCIPNAEIYDFYGPTEATIYCTYYKFNNNNNKQVNGILSIGRPMNGLTALILNENNKCVQPNEKGELCIAGEQLTPGYWHNPDKNRDSFFEFIVDEKKQRFYRTGDLCYADNDGDIMYCGRIDYQVKIQGYRVELGEIEFHARKFLEGNNAVALPFQNQSGNTEIALFLEGELKSSIEIIDYLKMHIPYYMIPTKINTIDQFPLNANGKIDRNVLKGKIN
jgi:D-alanine--poly(phosphoribitol) ligase subunit 1